MKKALLGLWLCMFTLTLTAQTNKLPLPDKFTISEAEQIWDINKHSSSNIQLRSAGVKQKHDSLVQTLSKDIYTYDTKGNLLIDEYFTRSTVSSNWVKKTKYTFSYDVNNNKTQAVIYNWSSSTETWEGNAKQDITYNANNQQTQAITARWSSADNCWINYSKYNYTYDVNGNGIQRMLYVWDETYWLEYEKVDYSYNINNDFTQVINYGYSSYTSGWENANLVNYYYDANGNCVKKVTKSWNDDTSEWFNTNKYEYTYDPNNNQTQEFYFMTNGTDTIFQNIYKREYTFDVNNNCTQGIGSNWDGSAYIDYDKYIYIYDGNNNKTQEIYYRWNSTDQTWTIKTQRNYFFDNSFYYTDLIYPWGNEIRYYYKLTQVTDYSWDTASSTWILSKLSDLYYSDFTGVGLPHSTLTKMKVIVENGKAVISGITTGENVAIYNIQGIAIFNQAATNEIVTVNLPARGVYVVRVGTESIKIMN
ncbi:MAG: hypothetical protein JXQ69_06640 [Paludibacteraceae bacterium]|nr:hypothetical protein [Paludibacteraceae bacterium]MBN2787983.1 hypothetical protein [Paludibacteraceae bacterium]